MSKAEKDFCKKCYQKDNCGYISRSLEHKCPIFQSFEEAEEKSMDIWKDAQGDDLPEIDREVIALEEWPSGSLKVVYAHRPDPKGDAKIYDRGGWNIPNLKYWLDYPLPE